MHSTDGFNGVGSGLANTTWTSPITGRVDVSGFAWAAREIGRSNQWAILLNGTPLTSGDVSSADLFDRSNPYVFANGSGGASVLEGVNVALNDLITLQVTKTSSAGDFVGASLTISQVPEPSTVLLTALQYVAVALTLRIRRLPGR